jgi:hypothetical protein
MTATDRIYAEILAEERLDNDEAFLGHLRNALHYVPDNDPMSRASLQTLIQRAEYSVERQRRELFGEVGVLG